MASYTETTNGIHSSHMAEAGTSENAAYSVENATVRTHAVWWLYPNTCLMRYPGRNNMIVMHIIPVGPDRTFETYDFYFEDTDIQDFEQEAINYIDNVLQPEDIRSENAAYSVENATVRTHAVWWLYPNTCLMRYPGRNNMIVMHIIPVGPDRTFETYDFYFEDTDIQDFEQEAINYIDNVLQPEDI